MLSLCVQVMALASGGMTMDADGSDDDIAGEVLPACFVSRSVCDEEGGGGASRAGIRFFVSRNGLGGRWRLQVWVVAAC